MLAEQFETPFLLVSAAFLWQLFFVSFYLSSKWRKSRFALLNVYPQETFPNLYVQSHEVEVRRLTIRRYLDHAILCIGLCVFAGLFVLGKSTSDMANWMIYVAGVQILPTFVSGYWCDQNAKLMSVRYPSKVRSARLVVNKASDFVSTYKLLAAGILYSLSLLMSLYIYFGKLLTGDSHKVIYLMLLSTSIVCFIFYTLRRLIFGKRADNFAEPEERTEKLSQTVPYLVSLVSFYSLFVMFIEFIYLNNLSSIYISVLSSLFFQLIIFSTREQYYPLNPSVYK
jgi:hypothetical protein